MARYISQVFVVVEADNEGEACDAMSGALSETLKYDGVILEWSYSKLCEGRWSAPLLLAESLPVDLEETDLDAAYAEAVAPERKQAICDATAAAMNGPAERAA